MSTQFGDTAAFTVSVISGTGLSYVWLFWDGTYSVTSVPTVSKLIDRDGVLSVAVYAVDPYGQIASSITAVSVNGRPRITSLTISNNNETLPYSTTLTVTATDPESQPLTYAWYEGVTLLGSGTSLVYAVTTPTVITLVIQDGGGGCTSRDIQLSGTTSLPPVVAANASPRPARIGIGQILTMQSTSTDPQGGALSFLWTFWDLSTSVGSTIHIGGGTYQNTATRNISGDTPGAKVVTLRVTNSALQYTDVTIPITLNANNPPVISSVTSDADPGHTVQAPTQVIFTCNATDPDGDLITYNWSFNTGATALGNPVTIPTSGPTSINITYATPVTTFSGSLGSVPVLKNSVAVIYGASSTVDDGAGSITPSGDISGGTINYATGAVTVTTSVAGQAVFVSADYRLTASLTGSVLATDSLGGTDTAATPTITVTLA